MTVPSTTPTGGPGVLMWLAATRWRVAVDRALAPRGLTHAQYVVLAALYSMGSRDRRPNQRAVAEAAGLDPLFTSKLVTALERSGLIDRTRDPIDARSFQLTMTEDGVATVRAAHAAVRELDDMLFADVGGLHGAAAAELSDTIGTLLRTTLRR